MDATIVGIDKSLVRGLLKALINTEPDLVTRRQLDVELRRLARQHPDHASALYATARTLRAPCREAARTAAGN